MGVGYKEEFNPKYCSKGNYLFEAKCSDYARCHKWFVPALTGSKQEVKKQFAPSQSHPAYKCLTMEADGCGHILCHDCFQEHHVKYEKENEGKRPKRKRG